MKIEGARGIGGAGAAKRAGKTTGDADAFSRALEEASGAEGPAAATTVSPVEALLIVQEVGDATSGRRRAVNRGNRLLDRLAALRDELLTGAISEQGLLEMQRLVASQREQLADPALAAVLDEIDLRVQVELAKLGMATPYG